jgi:uncharacterized protein (TIGR02646 family)
MIKVDRSGVIFPRELIERGQRAKDKLQYDFFDIPFSERIQKYPKFDDRIWHDARPFLAELFKGKCVYCETYIIGFAGEVDHFRPKMGAIGLDRRDKYPDYYWWLAYTWENLYLSCRECNFNKGSKFPVQGERGEERASLSALREQEEPLLLDPCSDDPDQHLAFAETGIVAPKTERGRITIEVLSLNRAHLVEARQREIADTRTRVLYMLAANKHSREALEEVLSPDRPYAAASRQTMHRFLREGLKDYFPTLDRDVQEKTLGQVGEASRFVSGEQQQKLDQDFVQEQQAEENVPVGSGAGDEFLFKKTQYITKVDIRNFRVIESLTLEFPPPQEGRKPWLILLGENGMGKSSILKAVALALMGEENYRALKLRPEMFLRRGCEDGHVEVHLTGYTKPFRLDFKRCDKEFRTNENNLHTLLFCYGGTRLLPTGRRRRRAPNDDYARINNLFDPFLPLLNAKSWLVGQDEERFGFSARAIKQLLTRDEERELTRVPPERPREVMLESKEPGGGDTLEALSDGYQSVIALAADILEIMLKHYDEVRDSEGIVLIDEIDVHLHPRWKVEIVGLLREVFPRVQFLVTTHDPLCLLGTLPGEVHVLRRDPETNHVQVKQVDVPPGTTADQVLTGFWFGLRSTLDEDTLAKLDRHRQLLREKRPETDQERQSLEATLRQRLGTYGDTSIDRMAQSVASEVIRTTTGTLMPEERAAMRQNIKQKLLNMLSEREKGG